MSHYEYFLGNLIFINVKPIDNVTLTEAEMVQSFISVIRKRDSILRVTTLTGRLTDKGNRIAHIGIRSRYDCI